MKPDMRTRDLSVALQDGRKVATPKNGDVLFKLRELGKLLTPSGRVICCDPFLEAPPLQASIGPGQHPVLASVAHIQGDQRIAYGILIARPEPPVRWEMALAEGEDFSRLEEGEFFGCSVDSGTACFVSEEAAKTLGALRKSAAKGDPYSPAACDEALTRQLQRSSVNTWMWADWQMSPPSDLNLIAFTSGWGDGLFPTYLGLDAAGRVTRVVTDFLVVWNLGAGP